MSIVNYTTSHKLYLLIWQKNSSASAFAIQCIGEIGKGPGIAVAYDAWSNPYAGGDNWSTELIAHESVNMFTGYVISGWPVDWWADHISPFPFSIKILVEEATGHNAAAQESIATADPLTLMFLNISAKYGPEVYGKMFNDLRNDGWTQWVSPNPSQILGEYVAAYLSIATNTSMVNTLNSGFAQETAMGHPVNYTLNAQVVNAIIARRDALESQPTDSNCWQLFREGVYNSTDC
jgi:hypothetical protein